MRTTISFLLGLALGALLAVPLFLGAHEDLVQAFLNHIGTLLLLTCGIVLVLVVLYLLRKPITRKIFGTARGEATRLLRLATLTIANGLSGKVAKSTRHGIAFGEELVTWWLWTNGLRWSITTVVTVAATFIAGLGTFLLYLQNEAIKEQGKTLAEQSKLLLDQQYRGLLLDTVDLVIAQRTERAAQQAFGIPGEDAPLTARIELLLDFSGPLRAYTRKDLSGTGCIVPRVSFDSTAIRELIKAGLAPTDLPDFAFAHVDFSDMSPPNPNFVGLQFRDTNFAFSGLSDARFGEAQIGRSTFFATRLRDADFKRARLSESCFKRADLTQASLSWGSIRGVTFEHARLNRANLSEGPITDTSFRDAALIGAYFNQQHLKNVDFTGANLAFASFGASDEDISFENVTFEGANLSGATFEDVDEIDAATRESLQKACVYFGWQPCWEDTGTYMDLPACRGGHGDVTYTSMRSLGLKTPIPDYEEHTAACRGN